MWNDEAPNSSAARPDAMETKRRLLAAVDDLRVTTGRAAPAETTDLASAEREIRSLRTRLDIAESARRALEAEVRTLENRALAAIAETGRLRRALDEARAEYERDRQETRWRGHDGELRRELDAAQMERSLLTSALSESESELARMARAIDLMTRKMDLVS